VQIDLVRNPTYWQGVPRMDGWRYAIVADPAEQVRQLISGTVDLAPFDPRTDLEVIKAKPYLAIHSHPLDSYAFLALNLADPQNPQPGHDANDARLPQPPHPILGDVRVREAIADALNMSDLLNVINGSPYSYQATGYLPMAAGWVYDPSAPSYHGGPDKAKALLEAAGWQASAGDGVRSKNGTPLQLTLLTNQENGQRTRMGELIQQNLQAVGFAIHFAPVPFAELTSTLLDQRFDLALAGWEQVGPDPATNPFWHSRDDLPGSGFNFVSFQDAEVDQWLEQAAQAPGCDPQQRAARYRQVQQRVHEQVPYVFIGGPLAFWGYNQRWQQVQLGPWGLVDHVQEWYKVAR
jgi:peptide/nickel transport system substrate-binding protein